MTIKDTFEKLLSHPSLSSAQPIFETYDKNVQGNTAHERGKTVCSISTCFRDFPELPEKTAETSVAIATGGNPLLAKVSAKDAAIQAVTTCNYKLACVGATPLAATDCLNFGNPEKEDQMQELIDGIAGTKEACETLEIPIVSGNVSLYNESSGKSIPPSAIISVFGRVDDPHTVSPLAFQKAGQTVIVIGKRSANLGGSHLLNILKKEDTHLPEINLEITKEITKKIQKAATKKEFASINIIHQGGIARALFESTFGKNIGAQINIPADSEVPQFLFSEDLGALITTDNSEKIQEIFGEEAIIIGKTTEDFTLKISHNSQEIFAENLDEFKNTWENSLRKIF